MWVYFSLTLVAFIIMGLSAIHVRFCNTIYYPWGLRDVLSFFAKWISFFDVFLTYYQDKLTGKRVSKSSDCLVLPKKNGKNNRERMATLDKDVTKNL